MKKQIKKAVPVLAVFGAVVFALVLSRAYTIVKPPKDSDGIEIEVPEKNFLQAVWLELKNVLKFSRYSDSSLLG